MTKHSLIIVGVGRSGSTVLHDLLACHPDFIWLTNVTNRFPAQLWLSRWMLALHRLPLVGWPIQTHLKPDEAYDFWDHYCRGFRAPCRDLTAEDLTHRSRQNLLHAFSRLQSSPGQRLLLKVTGWPRLGFLSALLDEARFIHVVRDGRAVANSLLQVEFWRGWQGPYGWRYGPLPVDLQQLWDQHNRSFVALAGIQWILQMRAMEAARQEIPSANLLQLRYEDLCEQTPETIAQVLEFAGLPPSQTFKRRWSRFALRAQNHKWQTDLTERQQATLNAVLAESLARWGYGEDPPPQDIARAA